MKSMYFYDAKGDSIFQDIMSMPEYYLTNSEAEIFSLHKTSITKALIDVPVDIIELGAGDGSKTRILLEEMIAQKGDVRYIPSDISENILNELKGKMNLEFPKLDIITLPGDYFTSLEKLPDCKGRKRVFFYLGANIGNLEKEDAKHFLEQLRKYMKSGDQLMVGFDLKKDPQVILDAYNDAQGFTSSFNLNLLTRINRELQANFNEGHFRHWESYNPLTGAARSYLVSTKAQEVHVKALNQSFHFDAWESIRVELSQKYALTEIEHFANEAGYKLQENFTDKRNWFVDSLWQCK